MFNSPVQEVKGLGAAASGAGRPVDRPCNLQSTVGKKNMNAHITHRWLASGIAYVVVWMHGWMGIVLPCTVCVGVTCMVVGVRNEM